MFLERANRNSKTESPCKEKGQKLSNNSNYLLLMVNLTVVLWIVLIFFSKAAIRVTCVSQFHSLPSTVCTILWTAS